MSWNWELENWPNFYHNSKTLVDLERSFLQGAGGGVAVLKFLKKTQIDSFIVEILSLEGEKSSAIEGEFLERESLQSSIQKNLGISTNKKNIPQKEAGVAKLICDIYKSYNEPLSHDMLFRWHKELMSTSTYLEDIGKYRSVESPMQIISNKYGEERVFFEAPPASRIYEEMDGFINWFNNESKHYLLLERAALVHVYFENIHPFEDGNGRIGRALVEKVLSQGVGRPTLLAVSNVIEKRKKDYYKALGSCNHSLDATEWIDFFAGLILDSQKNALELINFLMMKSYLMVKLEGKLNSRQEKVLLRMFEEGPKGFKGGLSADNYISITKASRATATRDLKDLIDKGALYKSGELRYTRYYLNYSI